MKTTAAQIEALKTILQQGGLWQHQTHMGRKCRGMVNKRLMSRLCELGLVEAFEVESPSRQQYRERGGVTTECRFFVTAEGALAVYQADLKEVK